jgi:hypothetical protein
MNVNSTITNNDAQNRIMIGLYTKLSVYVRTVRTLLEQFSAGNFYTLANILTAPVYNKMSVDLQGLAAFKFLDYENIRLSTMSSLQGLYQSVIQYVTLVDTQVKLDKAREYEKILKDPVKLQEYIKMLQGRTALFKDSSVRVIPATAKPEYLQYIKLYGYPKGGIFEMEKLAPILRELGIPLANVSIPTVPAPTTT